MHRKRTAHRALAAKSAHCFARAKLTADEILNAADVIFPLAIE